MLSAINFRQLSLIFFLISGTLSAQRWEVGGFIGGSNYTGDLARNFVPSETNFSAGVLGKYNFNTYWSYKWGINYAKISGGDYNFQEYKQRNLDFFSPLWELDNRIEFNYQRFGTGPRDHRSTAFVFAGLNVFYFNPKTKFNGSKVELRPLGTEGQTLPGGKKYSLVNVAIPLGIGYKFSFSDNWVLGAELGFRKTFTDYLDDVSKTYPDLTQLQNIKGNTAVMLSDRSGEVEPYELKSTTGNLRGNPNLKDWYVIAGITITYRFTPILCGFSKY